MRGLSSLVLLVAGAGVLSEDGATAPLNRARSTTVPGAERKVLRSLSDSRDDLVIEADDRLLHQGRFA